MRRPIVMGASLAVLLTGSVLAAGDLESGPQVGQRVGVFNPLHCTGPDAGSKTCLVWKNGSRPVAMIVARDVTGPLTSLVKKIDEATAKNAGKMGSFVVFINDSEGFDKKLEELAKKEGLKHTILTVVSNPKGPPGYHIAKDAEVTVLLYVKKTVKANYAYPKGELRSRDVDKIVGGLSKILPKK